MKGRGLGGTGGSCRRLRLGVLVSDIDGMELSLKEPVPCKEKKNVYIGAGAGYTCRLIKCGATMTADKMIEV